VTCPFCAGNIVALRDHKGREDGRLTADLIQQNEALRRERAFAADLLDRKQREIERLRNQLLQADQAIAETASRISGDLP
jgi:hypothetical protein